MKRLTKVYIPLVKEKFLVTKFQHSGRAKNGDPSKGQMNGWQASAKWDAVCQLMLKQVR